MTTIAATTTAAATDTSDDGQGPTTTSLLGAAFQLPLQFALGIRTSLFVGRHRRYPSMIAG